METFSRAGYEKRLGGAVLCPPPVAVCGKEEGFTLLEMVLVIVTLSILSFYMVMPSSLSVNRVALARQLVNDIRLAQSSAMNFNPSPGATIVSTGASTYQVCTPSAVCSSMNLGDATVSGFNFTFDGYGATADGTITVTLGGSTSIRVTGATGLVEVLP